VDANLKMHDYGSTLRFKTCGEKKETERRAREFESVTKAKKKSEARLKDRVLCPVAVKAF